VSLISRLRAVVAGDDFLDSDFDELDYETSDDFENFNRGNKEGSTEMATISQLKSIQAAGYLQS
jgi:cell division inhibitor SepF